LSDRFKRVLISVLFTVGVVVLIGLCVAPLPVWTPAPTPTPVPTPTPEPNLTVCSSGCDFTTLQEAIDDAGSGDVIGVLDAIHTEQGIVVNKDVTILGQSPGGSIVQAHAEPGEATESVIVIADGATVTIKDLTIRHGNPQDHLRVGGGINNSGTLTVERCLVTKNNASTGGGVHNAGTMTISNSTVSNNTSDGTGRAYTGCGVGGGIKNLQGPLVIINTTVSGNSSWGNGGGIFVSCNGTLDLVNSTVSGNHAAGGSGGGIYVRGVGHLTSSTVARNVAAGTGGGVYVKGSGEEGLVRGWLDFANTIIADNTDGREYCCDDCVMGDFSTIGINANNLVEDGSCSPDLSGDPLLGPLADNGGGTMTHALLADSRGIDAISAISCTLASDQRGMLRPVELTARETPCDIGAFELQPDER
jgi:hypothetical protein